ncbi:MAG: trimethylamine methyltransferase family protein [Planctomycetia bacterium]|nr:trimethylamine methyltransferase family protein [Planctomycetia bacterium]
MGKMSLGVLSDAEVEKLHEKTLEVLEKTGARITHDEALAKLKAAGARVDEASGRVRFPAAMVNELLARAPATTTLGDAAGRELPLGGDTRLYQSLILDPFVVDYQEGLRRPVLEDVRRHTILGESLQRISGMHRMAFPVSDVPEPDCYYKTMEIFLCHTTKHILAMPTSERDCQDWVDVMAGVAAASGRPVSGPPLVTVGMAVTSPLAIHGPNVEIMKIAMRHGCVILPTVCPMAGTTSPYSVAGTALAANVESLLPTLLAQVYKPGHPVLYAVGPSVTDMRTGNDLYYRTEKMLFKMIGCRMARYYKLPICGEAGGTLTHRPDMQNGAESMMYLLASITGGQNIIGGLGSLHNANGMSAEQIVMQCGLVDMAEFVARGVDTSDRKLAVDSIDSVGPGGNFLTDALTIDLLRSDEFFDSRHLDLTGGYVDGAPGMFEKAHEEVENRISGHRSTVPEAVRDAVRSFCQAKYQAKATADVGW